MNTSDRAHRTATMPSPTSPNLHLLARPPELRNEIFKLLLIKRKPAGEMVAMGSKNGKLITQLLFRAATSCYQMYHNMLPVFFRNTLFALYNFMTRRRINSDSPKHHPLC